VAANRLLHIILTVLAWIVVPAQFVTTLVLGLFVSLSFGLLLLPISLVWMVLFFPMVGASWLCSRAEPLRNPIGFLGIPWAVVASTYVCLMPSMGEFESRAEKLILTDSWPFSWEFWQFQTGQLDIDSTGAEPLREILIRVSRNDSLMQRTIDRLQRHQPLDSPSRTTASLGTPEGVLEVLLPLKLAADLAWPTATDEDKERLVDPIRSALKAIEAQSTPEEQAEHTADLLRTIYGHPEHVLEEHRAELMLAATQQRLTDLLDKLPTVDEADRDVLMQEMHRVNLEYIALKYPGGSRGVS